MFSFSESQHWSRCLGYGDAGLSAFPYFENYESLYVTHEGLRQAPTILARRLNTKLFFV